MSKKINIACYTQDYGQGRIVATYDNGLPCEAIQRNSFDTLADALAWISRIVAEETEINPASNAKVSGKHFSRPLE